MRRELTVEEASTAILEGRVVTAGGWDLAEVNDLDRIEAELKRLDVPFLNSREGGK